MIFVGPLPDLLWDLKSLLAIAIGVSTRQYLYGYIVPQIAKEQCKLRKGLQQKQKWYCLVPLFCPGLEQLDSGVIFVV